MTEPDIKYNGWNEWAKYVLKSIERLEYNLTALEEKSDINKIEMLKEMAEIKKEIAMLKTKAAVWGGMAASIPAIVSIIISILLNLK